MPNPPILKPTIMKKLQHLPHPEVCESLDIGQIQAVLSNNSRTLVLAGAGAGKTRVIAHRILHLIKNLNVPAGNILAVTFSREATKEMRVRLKEAANRICISHHSELLPVTMDIPVNYSAKEQEWTDRDSQTRSPLIRNLCISTIHAFCYHILKTDGAKIYNTNFKVVGDELNHGTISQAHVIHLILAELSDNQEFLHKIKQFIIDYLIDYKEFNTQQSIRDKYIALDGAAVRSKSERDIANFLIQHNIRYCYEKKVEWADTNETNKNYHPDFYLPDLGVYIEHWLISSSNEELPPSMEHVDKQKYLKEKEWKLAQFAKHKKILIQSHEYQMRGNLSDYYHYLLNELQEKTNNFILQNAKPLAIIPSLQKGFANLITSLANLINLAKSNETEIQEIKENLKKEKHEEILQFYDIFMPVFESYTQFLIRKSLLDFNDMIYKTIGLFKAHPPILKKYQNRYKHICIDEYQDVSASQVELVKLLLSPANNLFAVGDDWQSIYGFRGAEVSYIVDFKKHFENSMQIILPYNYRSSENIVKASSFFIHKNKSHLPKKISSKNKIQKEKIFQYDAINEIDGANFIFTIAKELLSNGYAEEDFLVLYRRSVHATPYKNYFKKHQFEIPLRTIHSAKGQEAKIVFVIGLKANSFPYVWEDPRTIQIIRKTDLQKKEEEERRIFYVAMTRAKEKLFLVSEKYNESEFCADIPDKYKKIKISEKQLTEEMLPNNIRETLSLIKQGKLVAEIAGLTGINISIIEAHVAFLIKHSFLNIKDFVADEVYEMISFYVPKNNPQIRLSSIKKRLPNGISYGQIRWVIADLQRKTLHEK